MKKISLIVPVFNCETCLHQCLKNLGNQSYKDFEIILVDDGSTDRSGVICDEYASKDRKITVIHRKNGGPAAARNTGLEKAKGEFIFFVDADDLLRKDALILLLKASNQNKADLIIGDYIIKTDKADSPIKKFLLPNSQWLGKQEIINYVRGYLKKPTGYSLFIFVWGKLYRSSIIKKNNLRLNEKLTVFEDIQFNFEYLKFTDSVFYLKRHLYIYNATINSKSAGNNIYANPVGFKPALESIKEFLQINGLDVILINKDIGNAYVFFAIRVIVRFFANFNVSLKIIYRLILIIVNDKEIRRNLKYYSPSKDDSKILPFMLRLKLVWPIIFICRYKAFIKWKR